ncbi:hypothetical protein SAY87_003369 [Trapa incisa]|uniref:Uncharacterized protein n=1 Tax=Trapa incisa TaxID=236973 RepID=A0AAN7QJ40_9MYRT|nr:hypothetical protein SAY87_003369 [Trapa incisa]
MTRKSRDAAVVAVVAAYGKRKITLRSLAALQRTRVTTPTTIVVIVGATAIATVPVFTSPTEGIRPTVDRWKPGWGLVMVVEIGVWRRAAEVWRLIERRRLLRALRSVPRVLRRA